MRLQPPPSVTVRRLAGHCIVALLAAGAIAGTPGAQAEQAEQAAPVYAVQMALEAGGEKSAPRVLVKAGEQFAVASGDWRIEMTVRQAKTSGDVWLAGKVFKGANIVSAPTLLAHLNEKAVIKVGDGDTPFTLSMTATPQP